MSAFTAFRGFGFALVFASIFVCAACTDGGFLEPPKPSGTIQATLIGGQYLATTKSSPLPVTGGFAISLYEGDYTAQFNASIVSFTADTIGPCYMVTMNTAGNVATFTPLNATAATGAPFSDPCQVPSSDLESVNFTDQNGHSNTQWYTRVASVGTAGTLKEYLVGPPAGASSPLLLSTTATQAQNVDQSGQMLGSFTVMVASSPVPTGPFTASIVSWTAQTLGSCYTVSPASSASGYFTFTLATPGPAAGGAGPSPCLVVGGDEEGIVFSDSFGDSNEQFFQH